MASSHVGWGPDRAATEPWMDEQAVMGLDTYAMERGADGDWHHAPDEPFEGLQLCDGWGASTFRGKVYADLVAAATGGSLYQQRIEPAAVAAMARLLRAAVEDAKRTGTRTGVRGGVEFPALDVAGCEVHAEEAEDLARWFEVCAERAYAVDGWW